MAATLGPALAERLQTAREHDPLDVEIFLVGEPARESGSAFLQPGSHTGGPGEPLVPGADERSELLSGLKARAAARQSGLLAFLGEERTSRYLIDPDLSDAAVVTMGVPRAEAVRSYWINNCVVARVSLEVVRTIAARDDVLHMELVRHPPLEEVRDQRPAPANSGRSTHRIVSTAELGFLAFPDPMTGVAHINAPHLWRQGLSGHGITVAVIDGGVNYHHPDLAGRMWNGGDEFPRHGWNFEDDGPETMDGDGHGTACAGIVAGDGTTGRTAGVAPGATVMALRVGRDAGEAWAAMQFALDHQAQVISMSLSWKYPGYPDYPGWRRACETVAAAGVAHANSVGNEGRRLDTHPVPFNVGAPGNCPPPRLHPTQDPAGGLSSAIGCGAADHDELDRTSARGPAAWEAGQYTDYPYEDGARNGLLKPDICAPGPGSGSLSSRYGREAGAPPYVLFGGTSAATPHVAGCLALLAQAAVRSGNPVVPARFLEALESTAVWMQGQTMPKENGYGSGRIDAQKAFEYGVARGWWA